MTAIRLTFSVENGKPKLVNQQRVTMRVPRTRHINRIDLEAGTWIETRDKDGDRLYARIVVDQALSTSIEVRTGVSAPGLQLADGTMARPLHIVLPVSDATRSFHMMRRETRGGRAKQMLKGEI
ncbi:MAG: hypothetical protein AAGH38_01125 [Pseudomonadota bacterium]